MEKLESQILKEAAWHTRLRRHAQSGKTIAACCRDESVSTASFHIWRAKLASANGHAANLTQPPAIIDLGTVAPTAGVASMAHPPAVAPEPSAGIDVRTDLSGDILLTITRR